MNTQKIHDFLSRHAAKIHHAGVWSLTLTSLFSLARGNDLGAIYVSSFGIFSILNAWYDRDAIQKMHALKDSIMNKPIPVVCMACGGGFTGPSLNEMKSKGYEISATRH